MINFRDFRIGWRLLIGEPVYSVVVIAGLALGFAACFLLLGYVQYSFTYDAQVPDVDRVYQIKQQLDGSPVWETGMALPFAQVVSSSALVETSSFTYELDSVAGYENKQYELQLKVVEPGFQKIFNVLSLEGDLQTTLSQPDAIAITVSTAQKIFGAIHVLHKIVEIAGARFQVTAILPDPPSNSNARYEALVGQHSLAWSQPVRDSLIKNWKMLSCEIYVKLPKNVPPGELEKYLQIANDTFSSFSHKQYLKSNQKTTAANLPNIKLEPLAEVYFDESLGEHGNKKLVLGLAVIASLILVIAATNYMNLAIVRTIRRQREIGLHKVLGAGRAHIVRRFVAESVLVTLIATGLGIMLAWLLLPWFSELMSRPLENVITLKNCGFAVVTGLCIGLATGAYPAWIALRINAIASLAGRGNMETHGGLWVRRVLTMMQFSIAMGLAGLTIAILWQTSFASHAYPGYDSSKLIMLEVYADFGDFENPDMPNSLAKFAFYKKLLQLSEVTGFAASLNAPGSNSNRFPYEVQLASGRRVHASLQSVTNNFFEIYRLQPRAGRLFDSHIDLADDKTKIVVNWTAAKAMGFASPDAAVGHSILGKRGPLTIIGIAPDILQRSLREALQPTIYVRFEPSPGATPWLTVRTTGDVASAQREIEELWQKSFPTKTLNMHSVQDAIAEGYADDLRYAKLLAASSALAIVIAAFGIYVLSASSMQRRTREIVLRKLYGAGGQDIVQLIGREFGSLIAISALIGLPVAYLASAKYLAEFVERAPMGVWPLLLALTLVLIVAVCATCRHLVIAMRLKPAVVLSN